MTSPEKLVVGLWKGTRTPAEPAVVNGFYQGMVADPVRPYVYTHKGGGAIEMYNVYKQTLVQSIPEVGGVLGAMAVAADGSTLYAIDTANRAIAVVDLKTGAVQPPLELAFAASLLTGLAYGRPDGVGMLLLGDMSVYQLAPWTLLRPGYGDAYYKQVTVAPDNHQVAYAGYSDASLYSLAVSSNQLRFEYIAGAGLQNGRDVAFSRNGSKFYTAAGFPYHCEIWDASNAPAFGGVPAEPYPDAVEVGSDGRVYCGIDGASRACRLMPTAPPPSPSRVRAWPPALRA